MYKQSDYVISTQRALIGCLTNNMNAITIAYKSDVFILRVYFDDNPSEEEVEVLSEITSEIAADFPELNNFKEEFFVISKRSEKLEMLDVWIIKKKEVRLNVV